MLALLARKIAPIARISRRARTVSPRPLADAGDDVAELWPARWLAEVHPTQIMWGTPFGVISASAVLAA
jgi:hypothetical protein